MWDRLAVNLLLLPPGHHVQKFVFPLVSLVHFFLILLLLPILKRKRISWCLVDKSYGKRIRGPRHKHHNLPSCFSPGNLSFRCGNFPTFEQI